MEDFPSKMEKTFSIPRRLMILSGTNPGNISKFSLFRFGFFVSFIIFLIISVLNATWCAWPNTSKVTMLVSKLGGTTNGLIGVIIIFMIQRARYFELLTMMKEEFWTEPVNDEEEQILLQNGLFSYKITRFFAMIYLGLGPSTLGGVLTSALTAIFFPSKYTGRTLWQENRYLSHMDMYADPYFQILLSAQVCGILCLVTILATIESTYVYLLLSVSCQFKILQMRILKFDENKNDKESFLYLRKCLMLHQKLIRVCSEINSCYTWITAIQYGFAIFYMCFNAYGIVQNGMNNTPLFLSRVYGSVIPVIKFYICCYCADTIASESEAVAEAAYMTNWVSAPKSIQKMIMIIIMRSQHPIHIILANYIPATLATFEAVMRLSYTFFTILTNTV